MITGKLIRGVTIVALVAVAFVSGLLTGTRHGFKMGLNIVTNEVSRSLETNVEIASAVRTGRVDAALRDLELAVDTGVVRLANEQRVAGSISATVPASPVRALGTAKAYREVVPAGGPDASDVMSILRGTVGAGLQLPSLSKLREEKGLK